MSASPHDTYQRALDKPSTRRASLGPAWDPKLVPLKPKRVAVSMPRQQRPLFVAEGTGFWPRPQDRSLCFWLVAFNVTQWAVLIFSIVTR